MSPQWKNDLIAIAQTEADQIPGTRQLHLTVLNAIPKIDPSELLLRIQKQPSASQMSNPLQWTVQSAHLMTELVQQVALSADEVIEHVVIQNPELHIVKFEGLLISDK